MEQELDILLVEDNPGDAMLLEEILLDKAEFSFKFTIVETLKEATEKLTGHLFDVILLDLGLPDSTGLMALEVILKQCNDIPIIVITGLNDENTGREAVRLGAQSYIIKGGIDSYSVIQSIVYSIERNDHLKRIRKNETLLKEKNDLLEELNAQKDRLISIISHDVRGPIGAVLNLLKILNNKYDRLDETAIRSHIDKCFKATLSTYQLIETLLEWAHTQSERRKFEPQVIQSKMLIANSINPLLEAANKKNIHIVDLTPENLKFFADPDMISTVIRNLISNAIKFSHHDSLVNIELVEEKNKNLAHIQVIDTGIGINADHMDKILDIGEGYSSPGTDDEKGTGFGLILCKELIEKNGGTLWIESKENIGTTINFTIPLKE